MPLDKKTLAFLLNRVDKPGRYTGSEPGMQIPKSGTKLKIALGFPDIYEIAMSNLGIRLLYNAINQKEHYSCERVFSPWIDMERLLRDNNIPLFTLESHSFLCEFDAFGVSMPTELAITNVLNMLDLAQIPLKRSERTVSPEKIPIIFCGGQGILNPEPYADFFDFFFIGEAETRILDILLQLEVGEGGPRKETLKMLSTIEGVYIPEFYKAYYYGGLFKRVEPLINNIKTPELNIEKRFAEKEYLHTNDMLPNVKPTHDRAVVEIARGCINGCRFCQSGYYLRPYRPKDIEYIVKNINNLMEFSYFESLGLLSLNVEDYPYIDCLIPFIVRQIKDQRINLTLPSIRATMISAELAECMSKVRKSGFTIAPEAGSQRLRDAINKQLSKQDILKSVSFAYQSGWDLVKCYFMIGLPFEMPEDIDDLIMLAKEISRAGSKLRNRCGRLNLGLSPFVPKACTPFQWAAFQNEDELQNKIIHIKKNIKNKKIIIKENSPRMAFVEAVLSTGDRRLSEIIYNVFNYGERFSNWTDHFCYELWKKEMRAGEYPFENVYRERSIDGPLPYDHIDYKIRKGFLIEEYEKARKFLTTDKCSLSNCSNCGRIKEKQCFDMDLQPPGIIFEKNYADETIKDPCDSNEVYRKLRLIFSKRGNARYIGNIDTVEAFKRMLRIMKLPLKYSKGFNPSPVYEILPPLPLGMEGYNEIIDIYLKGDAEYGLDIGFANSLLPQGLRIKHQYFTDCNDISTNMINCYFIGIEGPCSGLNILKGLVQKHSDRGSVYTDNFLNMTEFFCFKVHFTKDRPFSLRRFYDYMMDAVYQIRGMDPVICRVLSYKEV